MKRSLLAEEVLRILSSSRDDRSAPIEVSDARVGLALIQLAAGKEVTALDLGGSCQPPAENAQRVIVRRMLCPNASHYSALGVPRSATDGEIRENYRRLIALVHPDVRPEGFPVDSAIRVNLAYSVLSDPNARAHYDESLLDACAMPMGQRASQPPPGSTASAHRRNTARPRRLDELVNAWATRRSLVWMAGLLVLPIIWALVSQSSTAPPTRLVEAPRKPRLEQHATVVTETRAAAEPSPSPSAATALASVQKMGSIAEAASRSRTFENNKALAGSTGEQPTIRPTGSIPLLSIRPPELTTSSGSMPLTKRDATRDDMAAFRPVLADTTLREASPVPGRAVAELLAQLVDAVEAGSVEHLNGLLGERMPGRAGVMADFERIFRDTRKRELRYVRIEQQAQSQPPTFSGVAELGLTAMDGTTSTQRLFLSGAVEQRGERVQLVHWSSHPVQ
ncbi:MAG: DnaJ domain-containing protein [Casimicrobiaceae bacterium]